MIYKYTMPAPASGPLHLLSRVWIAFPPRLGTAASLTFGSLLQCSLITPAFLTRLPGLKWLPSSSSPFPASSVPTALIINIQSILLCYPSIYPTVSAPQGGIFSRVSITPALDPQGALSLGRGQDRSPVERTPGQSLISDWLWRQRGGAALQPQSDRPPRRLSLLQSPVATEMDPPAPGARPLPRLPTSWFGPQPPLPPFNDPSIPSASSRCWESLKQGWGRGDIHSCPPLPRQLGTGR